MRALCLVVILVAGCSAPPAEEEAFEFVIHEIASPGEDKFGQTSAVDLDGDGDVDFVSGARGGTAAWFEYRGAGDWVRHVIGGDAATDVGGTAFDVDGDGDVDQVSGSVWYRNSGDPKALFERFENGAVPTHDNLSADVDGDGRLDLLSLLDQRGVFWYSIPEDATQTWVEHPVLGPTDPPAHGGLAAGDIDGDGDVDLARIDRWLENADGRGGEWIEHVDFEFGQAGPWGLQTRAELIDLDGDGDLDLVQAEGDLLDGRVAWFRNEGGGETWTRILIREAGHGQDFHSICVADFDSDGDPDVFSGGGPLTEGEHRWLVWENVDGGGERWREHVIATGRRTHESVCADVDGDGDVDILTKPWNGDLHLFAENRLAGR